MRALIFVLAWVVAEATGPFSNPTVSIGGQVWRSTYDFFCPNYTTQTVTFIGGTPDLYNASGLPWNQIFSVGTKNPLASLTIANLQCSTLTSVPDLPTKIPVPRTAFVNGINAVNNFKFPDATNTQDTYEPLTAAGIAPAVQIINDATTNNLDTMRFFFKTNFATLAKSCTSLGSTYVEADDPTPVQYVATVPIVAMARSSAGTVVLDKRIFTVVQTAGSDIEISLTGGPNYQLATFLEASFYDTSLCATGKIQLVFQFGMQYTSNNASYLVSGPRVPPGLTILPNCYNLTTRSILAVLPCVGSTCISRVQIQTECRTALTSGLTFASCKSGQSPDEQHEVFFNAQAAFCNLTNPTCRTLGTNLINLPFKDQVRASVAIAVESQFLEVLAFYPLATTALASAFPANYTAATNAVVYVAVYFPYIETQRDFDLTISNGTSFKVNVFAANNFLLASYNYTQFKKLGALTIGVKGTRKDVGGLLACDALAGCDSFAINLAPITNLWRNIDHLGFNLTTIIPGGYDGLGVVGTPITQSITGTLKVAKPLDDDSSERANLFIAGMVLLAVGAAALIIGASVILVGVGATGTAGVAGKYHKKKTLQMTRV